MYYSIVLCRPTVASSEVTVLAASGMGGGAWEAIEVYAGGR